MEQISPNIPTKTQKTYNSPMLCLLRYKRHFYSGLNFEKQNFIEYLSQKNITDLELIGKPQQSTQNALKTCCCIFVNIAIMFTDPWSYTQTGNCDKLLSETYQINIMQNPGYKSDGGQKT